MRKLQTGAAIFVAAIVIGAASLALANNPPPPFTDPSTTTTNALGGVSTVISSDQTAATTSVVDVASSAALLAHAMPAGVLTAANAAQTRIIVLKAIGKGAAATSTWRVCAQLGGTSPGACNPVGTDGVGYGCTLLNAGDSCQWTIRPQSTACTSWDACHSPVWVAASETAFGSQVEVSLYQ